MALGLEDAPGSAGSRMLSPVVVGSVDLNQAPSWVQKDYETVSPLPQKVVAAEADIPFPSVGER